MKKSFIMYESWGEAIEAMTDAQAGQLLKAIYAYQNDQSAEPEDLTAKVLFMVMRQKLAEDNAKYRETCEKRRIAAEERWKEENAKAPEENANACKCIQVHGDNDTDTDTEHKCSVKEKTSKKKAAASAYDEDPQVNDAVLSFIEHRRKLRKPMTDRAITLFLRRLEELSGGDPAAKVRLIDTAIERGWQSVYPEEKRGKPKKPPNQFNDFRQRGYDMARIEDAMQRKLMSGG